MDEDFPKQIIEQTSIQPEPSYGLPGLVAADTIRTPDAQIADGKTLTFNVYLMYKLNMLTRVQVRDYLNLVKEGKHPDDVLKFLQSEVAKI